MCWIRVTRDGLQHPSNHKGKKTEKCLVSGRECFYFLCNKNNSASMFDWFLDFLFSLLHWHCTLKPDSQPNKSGRNFLSITNILTMSIDHGEEY